MAAESDADRLSMLSTDDHGVPVVCDGGSFSAIFDNGSIAAQFEIGEAVIQGPSLLAAASDLLRLEVARGAVLEINDTEYVVEKLIPDGTGMTQLVLQEL